ncbi:MAG TPA: TetR/AcrR family transcriptional regulator [Stellaceae bacterium]|nr:TetR/AcrR family transcriptional regulator [Stellaceae bacterium]
MRVSGAKEKIDKAAVNLFAARGVDGVSIADIAAAAGVAQGALYRHYRGKDELAAELFAEAYLRTGEELAAICATEPRFAERIEAMVAHFCALYDRDPALFRFMLIAQHDLLPRVNGAGPTPVAAIEVALADGIATGEIAAIAPPEGAAVIMGIVLQTALFHIYGRLAGQLSPRAPALAWAALAAIGALASIQQRS